MRVICETESIVFGENRRLGARSHAFRNLTTLSFYLYADLSSSYAVHSGPVGSFISIAATLASFSLQYIAGFFLPDGAGPAALTRSRIAHALKPGLSCVRGASDATAS
ncbi:hypothetical protein Snov_2620 [Ancylobacter novellus DSM 506]|uniref:Uncharacterized protein n=1 Tax=Ancylobacter novellus (strain ATCC 8093 / DSM 506 / JCM 20403 / CCM 1077 / IAM 12100 / NBRC 12443 / NCIMB 10456) TaxID=639283 RepID=D7A527_ANCN5|nr:hypothetical protein Snov_2620 [Ancylobacter novellus DSM 506]